MIQKKELVTELLSSLNNENITSLTIEDYDSQRYMLCITIQQSFFDDDPTPSKIRDFINDTKQIASKHSNKIFQYYITIISQGIKTRFCSYPTKTRKGSISNIMIMEKLLILLYTFLIPLKKYMKIIHLTKSKKTIQPPRLLLLN